MRIPAPVRTDYHIRDDNDGFSEDTLVHMKIITNDYVTPEKFPMQFGQLAQLARTLYNPDPLTTALNIFAYLKARIQYTKDPKDRELVRSAWRSIFVDHAGDCDDMSVAAATLLKIAGINGLRFRAIAWRDPENFTHVYLIALIQGVWVPFDLTMEKLGEFQPEEKKFEVTV